MFASAVISLGVAGSALAWPSHGHSRHAELARALEARQTVAEPVAAKAPVSAAWYASWHAADFPLANVSWSKYTTVTYSFALTTPNVSFVNITDPEVFKDFVSTAHANNCSASISVGGWTGSQYFSPAVATAENRTAFVKTMTDLVQDNNLDGLDFDWEYPGAAGIGCNAVSANDTSNFLAFLTELRTALPNTTFSAATSLAPFLSSDLTTPSTNVSSFASVLDYIALMNYDVWGPWSSTVGPNAPLNDTCVANATQQVGSAVSAVKAWTDAGIPADQLVLAVASYGHSFSVPASDALTADNTMVPYPPFNATARPAGDAWDPVPAVGEVDVCGNAVVQGGNWNFWGLVEGGFLNENGTVNAAGGIVYRFDECSQTPYVYNKTSGIMVSYDDAASFAAKGAFIKSLGLRGFAMWELGGDYNDILVDSIRSAAGFPEVNDDNEGCEEGDPTSTAPAATATEPAPTEPAPTPEPAAPEPAAGKPATTSSTKVAVAAAPNTQSVAAPATRTRTYTAPAATATPDPDVDDEECEDEDPETSSAPVTSSATGTKTASAASATETDDCDDYDDGAY
ncbi:glycoside hydrolase [Ceratobasidium sp. AG-I]|nr:glycoside hydrolase [Ceratobasidium sp. AG-I]